MKFNRKLSLALLIWAFASCAAFAAFPEKDIKFIVPFAPGGGTDNLARILAAAAGKKYFGGHSLIVENMAGGGAVIGQTYVAKTAPADGYTVLLFTSSSVNNTLLKNVTYSYKDFKPIIGANSDAAIIAVPTDSPYKTLEELFNAARAGTLKVATPGHSTSHHIRALNMARQLGLHYKYIHNDSAGMQLSQLMGSHVDLAYMTASEAASAINSGKARGLGIMSRQRDPAIPDVPTFLEQGYDGWIDGANRGVGIRADVPEDIYQYLVEEFHKVATSPEFIDLMTKAGMSPVLMTPEEFQDYIDFTAESITSIRSEITKK